MRKAPILVVLVLGIGAYLYYKYAMKKDISSGYAFPNGFSDLDNWQNADDGSESPENKLTRFMIGIAKAEGYQHPGTIPYRANNPGDLTRDFGYPTTGETLGSAGIIVFSSRDGGWAALEDQFNLIKSGNSIHKLTDTILQFAQGYTTTQQDEWAANVSAQLGLDSNTTLQDALS